MRPGINRSHAFTPAHGARRLKIVLVRSLQAWFDHRADSKGAALAFYTLFSMLPILVMATTFAGYFFGAEAIQGEVAAQVQGLVGAHGARAIQALLAAAHDPAGLLATVVASALLLLGATSVFVELKGSLDELWGRSSPGQSALRALLRTRLLSLGMVLVLAALLIASLLVSAALSWLAPYAALHPGGAFEWLALAASLMTFAVITALFAVIYKTLPDAPLSWRDAWIGALFTAGLFSLGKTAIALYLGNSEVVTSFGAAGSMIALLLWVYYSAQICFFGAEFTRQYALVLGSLRASNLTSVKRPHLLVGPP